MTNPLITEVAKIIARKGRRGFVTPRDIKAAAQILALVKSKLPVPAVKGKDEEAYWHNKGFNQCLSELNKLLGGGE